MRVLFRGLLQNWVSCCEYLLCLHRFGGNPILAVSNIQISLINLIRFEYLIGEYNLPTCYLIVGHNLYLFMDPNYSINENLYTYVLSYQDLLTDAVKNPYTHFKYNKSSPDKT